MPVNWLAALSGLAGAGRGYENAKLGRRPGPAGAAPAGGGGGLLSTLAAQRQQRQQPQGQPQPEPGTAGGPPGGPQGPPPPGFLGRAQAGPFTPVTTPPPTQGISGMPPGLMNPVPGGSAVPGIPNLPMQGPRPPAMPGPTVPPPSGSGPPPGMGGPPPGGPPPGAGGPPSGGGGQQPPLGGDDNDYNDNPDLRMANGGIVDKPTTALLGEDGPEMVVPLNRRPGNKVSPQNLPGRRPMPPPGAPGVGAPVGPPRPPMISPAMRYRSRMR